MTNTDRGAGLVKWTNPNGKTNYYMLYSHSGNKFDIEENKQLLRAYNYRFQTMDEFDKAVELCIKASDTEYRPNLMSESDLIKKLDNIFKK